MTVWGGNVGAFLSRVGPMALGPDHRSQHESRKQSARDYERSPVRHFDRLPTARLNLRIP
jgi:hypothetical protein